MIMLSIVLYSDWKRLPMATGTANSKTALTGLSVIISILSEENLLKTVCLFRILGSFVPCLSYLSSRKYESPRLCGGWFSLFLRMLVMISTMIVTTYGSILYSSLTERFMPVGMNRYKM